MARFVRLVDAPVPPGQAVREVAFVGEDGSPVSLPGAVAPVAPSGAIEPTFCRLLSPSEAPAAPAGQQVAQAVLLGRAPSHVTPGAKVPHLAAEVWRLVSAPLPAGRAPMSVAIVDASGETLPAGELSRNLLRYGSVSGNGMDVSVNADGSLRVAGTPTDLNGVQWELRLPAGTYALSASGIDGTGAFAFVGVRGAGGPRYYNVRADGAGDVVTVAAGETAYLCVRPARQSDFAPVDAPSMRLQLESGSTPTAWERPDEIDWGGVASPANLWLPVSDGKAGELAVETRGDGAILVAGDSRKGVYGQRSSALTDLADAGLAPGDELTLSCAGVATGVTVNVKFFGEDGGMVGSNLAMGTSGYVVKDGAVRMTCNVIEDGKGATGVSTTLWPMLERGGTAHPFEPYDLGGGSPLSNLWRMPSRSYSSQGLAFSVRDDMGVHVAGTPKSVVGWQSNKYMRGEPGALEPGVAHFFEADVPDGANLAARVIWQRADLSYATMLPGSAFTLPDDYVEVHFQVQVLRAGEAVDATVHPMLTRSSAPTGYFVPYEIGGGSSNALIYEPFVAKLCEASWEGGRIVYSGANEWGGSVAKLSAEFPAGRWRMVLGGCARFSSDRQFAGWVENEFYVEYGIPYVFDGNQPEELEVSADGPFRVGVVLMAGDGACLPQLVRLGDA